MKIKNNKFQLNSFDKSKYMTYFYIIIMKITYLIYNLSSKISYSKNN